MNKRRCNDFICASFYLYLKNVFDNIPFMLLLQLIVRLLFLLVLLLFLFIIIHLKLCFVFTTRDYLDGPSEYPPRRHEAPARREYSTAFPPSRSYGTHFYVIGSSCFQMNLVCAFPCVSASDKGKGM